jgi:hypothetical protein
MGSSNALPLDGNLPIRFKRSSPSPPPPCDEPVLDLDYVEQVEQEDSTDRFTCASLMDDKDVHPNQEAAA